MNQIGFFTTLLPNQITLNQKCPSQLSEEHLNILRPNEQTSTLAYELTEWWPYEESNLNPENRNL